MVYSTQTLVRIGREIVKKHPDLATAIIEEIPKPKDTDLSKIPNYFNLYCSLNDIDASSIKGPVFKSSFTEKKKVFIGAMYAIYAEVRLFSKNISEVLGDEPWCTSWMLKEVKFRYVKDQEFKERVNKLLHQIRQYD